MTETRVITLEEAKKHNTLEDCWLVMFEKVYDVTKFMDDHPGGSEIMLDVTGRDATEDFEDVVHSSTARKQLDGIYIGELHEDDIAKMNLKNSSTNTSTSAAKSKSVGAVNPIVTFIKAILPFLILAVAYFTYKTKA